MNKAENMVFKVERGASKMEDNIKLLPYLLKNFYELDYHKIQNMPHEYDNLLKRPTSGFDHDRISYLKPINKNKTYTMYYRKSGHYYKVDGKFRSSSHFDVKETDVTILLDENYIDSFVIFKHKSQFGNMFGRSKNGNNSGKKNGTHKSQFGNIFGKMFGRSKNGKKNGNNSGNKTGNNSGNKTGNNSGNKTGNNSRKNNGNKSGNKSGNNNGNNQ